MPNYRKLTAAEFREVERKSFIRGSALAVAHMMTIWDDDNLALAFNDLLVTHIKGQKPDVAKYSAVVAALCDKYEIELQGDREILELVYEPTIKRGGPAEVA